MAVCAAMGRKLCKVRISGKVTCTNLFAECCAAIA
jgi:hypothetical protein